MTRQNNGRTQKSTCEHTYFFSCKCRCVLLFVSFFYYSPSVVVEGRKRLDDEKRKKHISLYLSLPVSLALSDDPVWPWEKLFASAIDENTHGSFSSMSIASHFLSNWSLFMGANRCEEIQSTEEKQASVVALEHYLTWSISAPVVDRSDGTACFRRHSILHATA